MGWVVDPDDGGDGGSEDHLGWMDCVLLNSIKNLHHMIFLAE